MRTMFLIACILILLLAATLVESQLPPEVLADFYHLHVQRALRDGGHTRGQAKLQEVLRRQTEHDLSLPELDLWLAKARDAVDLAELSNPS